MYLFGIDIGGTKTSLCVGTERGEVLASERILTSGGDSLDSYFRELERLFGKLLNGLGVSARDVAAAGISAPGPLSVKNGVLIEPPNNPGWRNVPIVAEIGKILKMPVFLNNDANAAALAEFLFGDYRGTRDMIYMTFSTGMGGGIIVNGKVIDGPTDTAGEIGHHTIDINGPRCGCGKKGCFEAFVGGRNVIERLKEKIRKGQIATSILKKAGGNPDAIDHKAFAAAAREGDPFAVAEWDQMIERLAQGIGNLIMILNPELIILGTIAVHEGDLVFEPLKRKLPAYTWKWPLEACRIVPSSLGGKVADLAALAVAMTGLNVVER